MFAYYEVLARWAQWGGLSVLLVLTACRFASPVADVATYDVVLRGGWVVDGTGAPGRWADVAIRGERIVAVGKLGEFRAAKIVDVDGLTVAPGFIDAHSHAARGLSTPELSGAEPLLAQGITTVVINVDGGGSLDLGAQRRDLLKDGLGVNTALLVPFGTIRRKVMGMADRAPTPAELESMKRYVHDGMRAGGFGLSTGLFYAPQSYATTEEVIELARVAGEYGGVYQSHIRDEADYSVGVVAAVDEVIRIARESGVTGVVTHVKVLGPRVWGLSREVIRRVEAARKDGIGVYADQYPYAASSTNLIAALVPRWAQEGGGARLKQRLEDSETRARIRSAVLENLDRRGGSERLRFTSRPGLEGRTLAAVAADRGRPAVEVALDLIATGGADVVSFNMQEDDIQRFMAQPWTMTSSDGGLVRPGVGKPHPRSYGTFPRKIRRYVLEQRLLDLETAIRSMTGLTAEVFGFRDRGVIRPGGIADVAVFDLTRLRDTSSYDDPHRLAEGLVYVFVNGLLALEDGHFTGVQGGRVIQRSVREK